MSLSKNELKKTILELLKEDLDFRYAVAGLIGIEEILRRLDNVESAIKALQEQVAKHSEEIKKLQEQVLRHSEEIRSLQEQVKSLQEQVKSLQEQVKVLQEQVKSLQEQVKILQEQVLRHSEEIRKLQEQVFRHTQILEEHTKAIRELTIKIDALGARWGILSEEAFRRGLEGVLKSLLGDVKVEKWKYYDEKGEVFGYPSMIDVDVVIKEDQHILVEIK